MKLKPRVELKRLAIFNLVIAGIFVIGDIFLIPLHIKMLHLNWSQLFRTEAIHDHLMILLGVFVFVLFPTIALVLIRNAWVIFKHLGKISDS